MRSELIRRATYFSPGTDILEFTVPLFDEYTLRLSPET
jgi:hypothetical protein